MSEPHDIVQFVQQEQEQGRFVPVPGKVGRVYWFSHRKHQLIETTPERAEVWFRLGEASRKPRAQSHSHPPRTNPMARKTQDDYWFEQYAQGPYGARQAVPAARRNPAKKNKAKANKGKWFKGGLYLPDTTQTISTVVPAPYHDYQDLTQRRSALVPGPYDVQVRLNPEQIHYTKNGQPYIIKPDGKARFIKRSQAARANGGQGVKVRMKGPQAMRLGQFSTVQTGGFQPVNRRNPRSEKDQVSQLMREGHSMADAWKIVKGKRR
jgi:hypothetical protein